MESVGVRELRQSASKLLRQVAAGQSLIVTSHGQPIAQLMPLDSPSSPTTPSRQTHGSVLDVEPIDAPPGTPSNAQILADLGAERTR